MLQHLRDEGSLEQVWSHDGSDAVYFSPLGNRAILVKLPDDGAVHVFEKPGGCDDAEFHERILLLFRSLSKVITQPVIKDGNQKCYAGVGGDPAANGKCIQTFSGHDNFVLSAAWSSDGASVLTASMDGTAKLWRATTGECVQTLSGHDAVVRSAVWSASGTFVLTASNDGTAKLWDAANGTCTQTYSGHDETLFSAVLSGDFLGSKKCLKSL